MFKPLKLGNFSKPNWLKYGEAYILTSNPQILNNISQTVLPCFTKAIAFGHIFEHSIIINLPKPKP
jgi:hypothetical protein